MEKNKQYQKKILQLLLPFIWLVLAIMLTVVCTIYVCNRERSLTMDDPDLSVTEVRIEEIRIKCFGRRSRYEIAVLETDQGSFFYPCYEYMDEETQEAFHHFEGKQLRIAVLNRHSIVRLNMYLPHFKDMQQMAAVAAESETPYSLELYNKAARSEKSIALFLIGGSFVASCLVCGLLIHFSIPLLQDEYRRKQNKLRKKKRKQERRAAQQAQSSGQTPKQGKK